MQVGHETLSSCFEVGLSPDPDLKSGNIRKSLEIRRNSSLCGAAGACYLRSRGASFKRAMTQAGTSDDPGVASATGPAADKQKQNPLLHHLVPGRECGPCNVCCKVMQIREPDFEQPGYV